MGLKGKPATSSSGSAQAWAQPYATQGAQDVINVYNQAQPGLQAIQSNVMGQLSGLGQTGAGLGKQASAYGKTTVFTIISYRKS